MKRKLVRITTVPISLEKLLEGQLAFMSNYFDVIAVSSCKQQLNAYGNKEGVRTYHLPMTRKITPLKDLYCVYRLYRFLKKEKPVIVHTHTPKAGIVGMMAARLARVPIRLHTVAGLPLMEASGFKRKILNVVEKKTYSYSTKVLPNSRGLKEIIVEEGFCSASKLEVLGEGSSNGIDCDYFSPQHFTKEQIWAKREELGISSDDSVFVFIGRIVKDKGIDELVRAFELLAKEMDNCKLLLVGPFENDLDPVSANTQRTVNEHSSIMCTGYQADVRIYLALSDFMVFPSYREGFPNVVMQAGAMELPVIASNINGCNEIIENGVNGLLVPVKDAESIYRSMQQLLQDKKLSEELKNNARMRIVERYDRLKMWNTILAEYERQQANL
ncbi:glycosyltransferase family 4 protein [Aureitalea sp. L0-47]|uniref:glycosyltransferase family 4 protein n=1 Tax=Aureitalea sp. L0-47 TaxID=2816962 RepID=UPI0022371183|nr:glycosyltransferase family 4 protein [Aureitalea sp. L0-47]MCW5520389.1 glycosyltransferase family 4 protein [Aureitalea sp. L0-47]